MWFESASQWSKTGRSYCTVLVQVLYYTVLYCMLQIRNWTNVCKEAASGHRKRVQLCRRGSLVRLVIVWLCLRVGGRRVGREDLPLKLSQHCLHAADEHSAYVLVHWTRVHELCAHIQPPPTVHTNLTWGTEHTEYTLTYLTSSKGQYGTCGRTQ